MDKDIKIGKNVYVMKNGKPLSKGTVCGVARSFINGETSTLYYVLCQNGIQVVHPKDLKPIEDELRPVKDDSKPTEQASDYTTFLKSEVERLSKAAEYYKQEAALGKDFADRIDKVRNHCLRMSANQHTTEGLAYVCGLKQALAILDGEQDGDK